MAKGQVLQRVREELQLHGYSPKTIQAYRGQIERFLKWVGKLPTAITGEEVRLLAPPSPRGIVSAASRNQARAAIKFLYVEVLREPDVTVQWSCLG